MKSFLKVAAGVIALSLAQQASAANVRITGSTAFRAAAHRAIVAMLGGDSNVKMAHTGSTQTQSAMEGANFATFSGTISSTPFTVQVSWSGSVEGIAHLTGGNPTLYGTLQFIPTTSVSSTAGVANATLIGLSGGTPTTAEAGTAKLAFSDVQQGSTAYISPSLSTPVQVGVAPFVWVANRGTTGIGGTGPGMTAQLARQLLSSGLVPKSMFTGAVADDPIVTPATGTYVLATGRNNLSGTRLTTLAETQYGVFTTVQQYKVTSTTGTAGGSGGTDPQIVNLQLWPVLPATGDLSVDPLNAGNGGYTSGGTMAGFMGFKGANVNVQDQDGNTQFTAPITLIGYMGAGDANTATNGTNQGIRMSYEGVSYTDATQNVVQNGQYTFWCYENLYTGNSPSADDNTVKAQLVTQMNNASILGTTAVTLGSMNVNRQTDGTVVGHN